ncbi:ESPR-type extended signal peptide-containing protein [Megasphaera elsdenii]|uniref:ESPR-type extended signal peptide-containing protein n=1 Tax=Megasphaera elsdenii TaxID=907 RepID=UPI003F7E754B
MNKTYKVIYNRTRCMYQVVSELAKGHTKSETPEMLKSLFNKHSGLTRGIVMAVLSMSLAMPVGVAVQADGTTGSSPSERTNTSSTTATNTAANADSTTTGTLSDSAVKYDTDSNKGKVILAGEGGTTITNVKDGVLSDSSTDAVTGKQLYNVSNRIGTLDANGNYIKKDGSVSSNLSALDTQVKTNADAISKEKTDCEAAVTNEQTAREAKDTELSNKITSNATDITGLKDLSNVSEAGKTVIKKQAKQAVKVAATGNATVSTTGSEDDDSTLIYTINVANNGAISVDDTNLVSGGTMYTELRPTGGTYVLAGNTTAANLLALDTNLVNVVNALGLDVNDTTKSYTSKLNKYFKVNPKITTSTDGTTYAPDAAANGTNAVAIGPSAQAGESTTDATTSTTTVTGGTSSTAVGDSAKANGNQAVALGYSASVLNPSSGTSTGSTAIGSNATVDSASNAMALGTKATINETATNGLAIGNGAVTGSAKTTATKADNTTVEVAAAGGVNSVAIGTGATNAGNTSIALGDGASVTNDTDGNYQAVVKSDDIAIGTSAKTSASDSSTAIGKSVSVFQSTDAVAIGSSATASSSNDALVLGKEAKAASAADSIAMGTSAAANSADVVAIGSSTSATGANSVVIGKSAQTTSEGGNAIGSSSTASGRSTAIGQSATANNFDALAIGNGATANADRSISLGYHAGVGTTEGKGETQTSGSLIAIGTEAGNNVAGMQNIAIGSSAGSDTKSNYNVAIGSSAGYNITYSVDSNNQNGYNVSIGYKANYQDTAANIMNAISIGEKTNAGNYAVAIGGEAQATGTNSIALGYKATAADTDSMALGYNSSAANGNIAIGVGSTAPKITMSTAYLTGDAAPSTYISVGTSDNLRRISNVADGSAAQDVVTVHQLTTAYTDLENTIKGIDTTSLNTYSTTAIDSKIADVKSQIANAKTKYFSYSTSTSTLAANADNTGATATAADAMAIGPNANATNTKTLAIGNNVYATGLRSIAIGTADNPTTDSAGTKTTHNTSAEGENSIALGTSTTAQSDNSVAIGTRAQTYTTDTTKGSITGVKAVAIGYSATTAGDTSVAVGNNATVKYASGTAVGTDSLADGTNAVAIGEGSKAYSDNSTAIGQGNSITGNNTYGLGSNNTVSGAWGSVTTSGVSGYNNSVTSVSDANTMNAISGIYITGNSNSLTQNVVNNVVSDITAMGSSNTIDAGAGGTSSHSNTLSQIAIVGSGNTVQGKSSDDSKTNNIKDVTILGYNNKVDANTDTTVDFSNTQILGSNVTAKLGNSVYLGSNAAYTSQTSAASDAITSARTAADAAAEASDAYKAATTDAEKAQIKAQYEAQYLYQLNVQAMEAKGTTAGTQSYSTDETYGDGTSYTYAGSSPAGVVTVGSVGAERRIQNVAAGLVSATSTDAVNGSQLYALTRQLRFGGDNSSFGTTTADDKNVVARGSNETLSIIGGADSTKLTDNNIGVMADSTNNTLTVKLSKNVNLGNDGSVVTGNTTLDNTGLTIANGPKFTSSGIDVASKKITSVKAGEADTDAANVGQVKAAAAEATTEVKAGTNASLGTLETSAADKHKIYTVNVDNLAVKAANGNASVALANGINFKDGTNTTATVDTDGTVKISATHNKLSMASAAPTGTNDDVTLTLTDADGNTVTSTGLKNTYTTVTKDGTAHTVTFARNDGTTETLSLGDLDGASKSELATAAAKATSEVTNGTNVTSVTKTTGNNGQNIYTVNVDDLAVKTTSGEKKSVHLADGLVFADGTNTTATVGDNGTVKFNVSDNAIKKQAVNAINVTGGSNVTVTPETNADGTLKTFTVAASDLKYSANGTSKTTSLANGISFAAGSNTTAEIDNNGAIKINATHNKLNATGTATKATADSNAVTLTLNDADGNTTTTALTDTYTTISKDGTNKKVTFKRNDGETQTLELSDLGGITAAQDKYVTGGTVSYDANGNGTASLTGNNGLTASITGLKDTKVSSGTASYLDSQGNATVTGTATLKMNDGTTATISGLKDDYITSAAVGTENNHVTMTRLGRGTVDLDLNPILGKYSLSDYHLVGDGTTHDQAYAVDSNGTVTLNVVDDKNSNGTPKTIQITGLASQSDVDAGWTIKGKDSTNADVNANIGKGKSVTYSNGNYTKAVVTKDDSGNATVTVDVTTGTLTTGTDGKITSADGLATTGAVASAVNGASWTIQDGSHTGNAQQVKAGDTVSFKAGDNLTLDQVGREFTYKLNQTLTNMNSVTAVDDKQNTAVLNGEGLKVTDAQGNALTQHATEVRLHDANKAADDTTTDVVLNKQGLQNGGHTITGVADGKVVAGSQEAVNGSQLYALQQKVGSGWKITGNNTASTTSIGADKTVSFINGKNSTVTVSGSDSGATVKVDVDTAELAVKDNKAVATGSGVADAQEVAEAINNAAWNVQKAGNTAQQVKAGDTVTFDAGDNMVLTQSGTSFTYGLAPDVNTNTIRLGGNNWTGGIYIGKQSGGGATLNEGDYITGLDNTAWDLSKVVDNRAATEGQLKAAINQVTIASQSGGFGLRDEKGSTVSQMLGQTVGIIGDTEYEADGKTVKQQGNITTEADSTNAGAVKVKLNKNLDLTEQGSVTMGTTTLTSGQVKVGQITVNGTDNTVSGLANTTWDEATAKADGYKGSTKAATESQLQAVYTQATTAASANEQHIQSGTYDIVTKTDGNGEKQNSVTMNIVDGSGNTKGQVVINDVAKASDLGDTTALDSDIQNKNESTSVVDAVNNLNGKVGDNRYLDVTGKEIQNGDSSTTAIGKLNNRMNDIYSKATQHSTVTRADDNVTIQTSTNADGGTNYQIGLNKEKIDLGNVTFKGNNGSVEAQSMKADTFTAGNTVVSNEGVKIGDKTALTSDTLKVNGKTYVSGDGLNANSQKITNVADGSADTDAVNVKQVNELAARQGEAIAENAAHIGELGRAVNKLGNRLNRVGAGAAALAALHPGTYDPNDKWDFSAGIGHYHDANAVAIGAYYHPNDTTILSIGGSMGGGENMVNAGITWKMGRSGHEQRAAQPVVTHPVQAAPAVQQAAPARPAPVTTPASVVTPAPVTTPVPVKAVVPAMPAPAMTAAPSGDTAALTQILARQTAILEKLAQNQSQAARPTAVAHGDDIFPDVPENHWAYAYVAKLEKAGALKGFKRPAVLKSPMMTRDDFASVLYTAMANGATTNPALNGDDSLNRLAQEFKAELKDVKP